MPNNLSVLASLQVAPSPLLIANPPDQAIPLGTLDLECIADGATRRRIRVSVSQSLLPSQRVALTYSGDPLIDSLIGNPNGLPLFWPGEAQPFVERASQQLQSIGNTHSFTAVWEVSRLDIRPIAAGADFIKVIAHVVSFPNFVSRSAVCVDLGGGTVGRANSETLKANGWSVVLAGHQKTKAYADSLGKGAAFAVTHSLALTREDGSAFSFPDADKVLEDVHYYLSFCVGRRIGMGAEIGIDSQATERFLRFGFTSSSKWYPVYGHHWWDTELGQIELGSAFAGFCALRRHQVWKDHLTSILYWYLEANQLDRGTIATDTGIVLAQMALEKLAWVYLVHDRRAFTERDFDKIAASGKIRAAAAMLGLPLEIPQDIAQKLTVGANEMHDIPHLITEVRNDIVHPKQRSAVQIEPYYVWNLAQWYIELMLLRLCGYAGNYNNRAKIKIWRTAPGPVPWAAPLAAPSTPSGPTGSGNTPTPPASGPTP